MNSNPIEKESLPLVVDLDGTLIKSDTLFESANQFLFTSPFALFQIGSWLLKGRSNLKDQLAERVKLDSETLPFQQEIVNLIRAEKSKGRTIVLATASSEIYANQIANQSGLFDVVLASTPKENLKGANKMNKLVDLFGDHGFDYVGDAKADIPVWKHANTSYMISPKSEWIKKVSPHSQIVALTVHKPNVLLKLNKTLRIHQWVKNLLIFLPLIVTHQITNPELFGTVLLAFLAFSLAASAIYVVNDLVDIRNDRSHPTKRSRSIASGNTSLLSAWIIWPLLLIFSLVISFSLISELFGLVVIGYIVLTTLYSLRLKRTAVIDVIALAFLYTTRIVAGAVAIHAMPSMWILSFSLFFFFSLALMKRFSELLDAKNAGKANNISGRGYSSEDLELVSAIGSSSGLISVLVFVLYVNDPNIAIMYNQPVLLWLGGVILLAWISRAWLLAHRGLMHEDPIVFAIRDKLSYMLAFLIILVFIMAMVI